jgi:hypothetical protein
MIKWSLPPLFFAAVGFCLVVLGVVFNGAKVKLNDKRVFKDLLAERYINLMESAVLGDYLFFYGGAKDHNFEEGTGGFGSGWPNEVGVTMVGRKRLDNVRNAIMDVRENNVRGDIVELGVWRGGTMLFAQAIVSAYNMTHERDVVLYDVFGKHEKVDYGGYSSYLAVELDQVKRSFEMLGFPVDKYPNIKLVKGLFEDTLQNSYNRPIAVLRMDGNFYDSQLSSLLYMYDKVSIGGWLIFDDILSHESVSRAWNHFALMHGLGDTKLIPVDWTCAYFIKVKEVEIQWREYRKFPRPIKKN